MAAIRTTTCRSLSLLLSRPNLLRRLSPLSQHHHQLFINPSTPPLARPCHTAPGYSPLNYTGRNRCRVPQDGRDYLHWLIVMDFNQDPKPSEEEMINKYVQTLAQVVGSEEEAKKKIYSVSTATYTGFGALISEELSKKVEGLPGVSRVVPDSYYDIPNRDYGGDLYMDGEVVRRQWHGKKDQPFKCLHYYYKNYTKAIIFEEKEFANQEAFEHEHGNFNYEKDEDFQNYRYVGNV